MMVSGEDCKAIKVLVQSSACWNAWFTLARPRYTTYDKIYVFTKKHYTWNVSKIAMVVVTFFVFYYWGYLSKNTEWELTKQLQEMFTLNIIQFACIHNLWLYIFILFLSLHSFLWYPVENDNFFQDVSTSLNKFIFFCLHSSVPSDPPVWKDHYAAHYACNCLLRCESGQYSGSSQSTHPCLCELSELKKVLISRVLIFFNTTTCK